MISLKDLYLNNPTEYSLYPYDFIKNKEYLIDEDSLIVIDNNELLTYYFKNKFIKIDFNKGYKKIIINESIYNKFILKKPLKFNYSIKKYIKICMWSDGEDIIEETGYQIPDKPYKLYTAYFEYKDDYLGKLTDVNKYTIWYELTLSKIDCIDSYELFKTKLEEIKITNEKPSLLLHSCCGPCSSECLRILYPYFDITILYYNPNIYPEEEYDLRLEEQYKIIKSLGYNINVITKSYNHDDYLKYINGTEELGEKSRRCYLCYEQRLALTAKLASNKYDYFTTTISISPYKVSKWLNEIGLKLEKEYNVRYLYSDFKQDNGYLKSIELSKKFNLYRQDYCGCEFSKKGK